ncbi:MAG: nucleotidyltransferase domain-containing protein [bacterium]
MIKRNLYLPPLVHEQLVRLLSAQSAVERVVLFGSRARGDAEERSDIDLSIEAPGALQRQWLEILFRLEEIDTLLPIHAVRWEEASDVLKRRIQVEGRVLYERSTSSPKRS